MSQVDEQRARRRAQAVKYVGALDGIRALAAVGVVIIHTESEAGASIATYVVTGAFAGPFFMSFFIITGFVLYRGWARKHLALRDPRPDPLPGARGSADGGSDGNRGRFLLRRLIRIYPLYWIVATAAMAVSPRSDFGLADRLQVYVLSPWPKLDNLLDLGLGIVVWTLIIDIAFYLYVTVHGTVMTALVRRVRTVSPFRLEHAVLIPLFTIPILVAPFVKIPIAALSCLPLGMWGAVVEAEQDRVGHQLRHITSLVRVWPLWCGLVAVLAPPIVAHLIDVSTYDSLITDTWPVVIGLVLLSGVILSTVLWGGSSWPFNRLLASRRMQQFGLLTYGLYLWHPVVLMVLREHAADLALLPTIVVTLALSAALAFVTYTLVERPLGDVRGRLRASGSARS